MFGSESKSTVLFALFHLNSSVFAVRKLIGWNFCWFFQFILSSFWVRLHWEKWRNEWMPSESNCTQTNIILPYGVYCKLQTTDYIHIKTRRKVNSLYLRLNFEFVRSTVWPFSAWTLTKTCHRLRPSYCLVLIHTTYSTFT